jgi:hypothetical protein
VRPLDRYPRNVRDWYASRWAIHPEPCPKCSARRLVAVYILLDGPLSWVLPCPNCWPSPWALVHREYLLGSDGEGDGEKAKGRKFRGHEIVGLAQEVPALVSDAMPDVEMHLRPGLRLPACDLEYIGGSFRNLGEARLQWAKNPPIEWALRRNEAGDVVAPADPTADRVYHRPQSAVLRPTVLRASRRDRKCFGCGVQLRPGDHVFAPESKGWGTAGLALRWCSACIMRVPVWEPPAEPQGIQHGPLTVFEGHAKDRSQ